VKSERAGTAITPNTVSGNAPKKSQRERLLAAMTQLAASKGYGETSIADLTARAGVSRQTFYECFTDKQDCFLASYQQAAGRVLEQIESIVAAGDWWETPARVAQAILTGADEDPETAWLFYVESLAATRMGTERRRALKQFESFSEAFLDRAPTDGLTLDVPPLALFGAIRNIVASRLQTNTSNLLPGLAEDLVAWMRSYAAPSRRPRWSTGERAALARKHLPSSRVPAVPRPRPLPRGRHGLRPVEVARNRYERIVHATAEVAREKGYLEMTVADIVVAAGIGRDIFYRHFADKQDAFAAAQQYGAQETFAACAAAFFAVDRWPERIWNGLTTLTAILAMEPALAHLQLVEPYAAGSAAIQRSEQMITTFAVFLEEGYRQRPEAARLPRLCSTAISHAVFETIRSRIEQEGAGEVPRYMPQLSYIAIAPFTGPEAAVELVERLVGEGGVEGADANGHPEGTGGGDRANRRGSATLQ
jgi:AcrR family transcriptional regulator